MPRSRKDALEFANFVCKFGDHDLLDFADEIVLPALTSNEERQYGKSTYFLHRSKVLDVEGTLALGFEFVKNTKFESEQAYEGGELVPKPDSMDSAPSALALLLLDTHRLVYFPKTRYAPTLRELAITCQRLLRREHWTYIESQIDRSAGEIMRQRAELLARIPPPTVTIRPLSSAASVEAAMKRFKRIRRIELRLLEVNNEIDYGDFFKELRAQQDVLKAKNSTVVHSVSGTEGMSTAASVTTVHAATQQGNIGVTVVGVGKDDEVLRQENDEISVKVAVTITQKTPRGAAPHLKEELDQLVDTGVLHKPGVVSAKVRQTLNELRRKWLG